MAAAADNPACPAPAKTSDADPLPPLSAADFRLYNRMAEGMNVYHNNFRAKWNVLADAVAARRRPAHLSLRAFIHLGLEFAHHLRMHHGIEEQHVFPRLAAKMPEFRHAAHLLAQHQRIHAGLEGLEAYLEDCRAGAAELRLERLGELMALDEAGRRDPQSWGKVLWAHLDDEVRTLGAENMRRYWTKEEMQRMPM